MRCHPVLLTLLASACMTTADAAPPVDGSWGTHGVRLTLSAAGGLIEEGCSEIALSPVTPAPDGSFTAKGRLTAFAGGPQAGDTPPHAVPVTVRGTLAGEVMTLTIEQSGAGRRELTLRQGHRGKIIRCL